MNAGLFKDAEEVRISIKDKDGNRFEYRIVKGSRPLNLNIGYNVDFDEAFPGYRGDFHYEIPAYLVAAPKRKLTLELDH